MAALPFDQLLKQLPEMAKAVNAFTSESAQLRVLDALLSAAGAEAPAAPRHKPNGEDRRDEPTRDDVHVPRRRTAAATEVRPDTSPPRTNGDKTGRRRSKSADEVSLVTDLNLRPENQQSFRDFFDEKRPSTNEQTFAVMIYYMKKVLGLEDVSADHIYTAFKDLDDRKVPLQLRKVISNSSGRHGWIDSSDRNDLKLTTRGDNFVRLDLPKDRVKGK